MPPIKPLPKPAAMPARSGPKPITRSIAKRFTAVGAYIFAGGFTVGVKQAGFDVRVHLEESNYGVATALKNIQNLKVYYPMSAWPLDDLASGPRIDFLYGNPPCAAWSQAGSATKKGRTWDSSSLVDCTRRYFNLFERLRPKVWAWESVQRAWTLGRSLVDEFAARAMDFGYSVTILLHDAQYLGVPQVRKRFFMVCHDVELDFIEPSWEIQTIDDALAELDDPGEPLEHNLRKHRRLLDLVRPGENLSSAWNRLTPEHLQVRGERGQMVGRPPFTIKRSRSGQPAPVVMHELIHPTEPRGLSIAELAHLCSYPQGYEFVGAKDAGQVGRGVCPNVGKYLAKNVIRAVEADVVVASPTYRLVDVTKPPMRIEPLRLLPTADLKVDGQDSCPMDDEPPPEEIEMSPIRRRPPPKPIARKVAPDHQPQPQPMRQGIDPDREFDKTSLRANAHGKWVHRDYGAHFFRWGWAARMVDQTTELLDVGCGPDCPLIEVLTMPRSSVPRRYVGVDYNREPNKHPTRGWAELHWQFNFLERHGELGQFDLVTCFEVIEHMRKADGERLLEAMRGCLKPGGRILLSTPVFNGKAAANHIHEWTIPELKASIAEAGLEVVARYGTFASWNDVKKVCSREELQIAKRISEYYSGEVMACFLAPLYPDASRNNAWMLKAKGDDQDA